MNSQRSAAGQPVSNQHKLNSSRSDSPCSSFNLGKCTLTNDHMNNGIVVVHICVFCFSAGAQNHHPEKVCMKKNAVLVSQ